VAGWLGGQETLNKRILGVDEVTAIINAITIEEVAEVAQELLRDNQLHLALVGPITDSAPLEKLLKL
ncbi:MAG: hypothetical protein KKF26_03380, partial [Chloroflexi bacterium]|nr:hypothetical protein [Chloroflexota bacterium]